MRIRQRLHKEIKTDLSSLRQLITHLRVKAFGKTDPDRIRGLGHQSTC